MRYNLSSKIVRRFYNHLKVTYPQEDCYLDLAMHIGKNRDIVVRYHHRALGVFDKNGYWLDYSCEAKEHFTALQTLVDWANEEFAQTDTEFWNEMRSQIANKKHVNE